MLKAEKKREIVRDYLLKKGFFINDGIKYGLDFLVYTESPDLVHSKYGVLVHGGLTFQQLISHQRVCNGSNKLLILAFVEEDGSVKLLQVERFLTVETTHTSSPSLSSDSSNDED